MYWDLSGNLVAAVILEVHEPSRGTDANGYQSIIYSTNCDMAGATHIPDFLAWDDFGDKWRGHFIYSRMN